ncbi:MAG: hypothetical protein ACE37I_00430 [Rubinisphaera brasiliensis]|uniref:NUDIX hydrolase n=1 Tax=Rubinisphaera brasiliensis (strain ATCC 49424 / DSM 5305 / JCM 21570 / IAM 15109 / NBRC 103401 / IFAM 1448) TaxID=756272 RepID=F0SFP6_RUBBR|nr:MULTISPECIES: hypothetical protein [Rubinisphaera]ADY60506.1 hypothetical protein Plabr_2907 [Rubinisphaera brasiliensis DSM 5305]
MNSFVGSVALVRHPEDEENRWLLKWSDTELQYRMIIAKRLEGETYRECLDREIAWELELRQNRDYLISNMSRLHIEEILQLDDECHGTFFLLEFFAVDLYGKTSKASVEANPALRWISTQEILAGQTQQGEGIDRHLVALLKKFELIGRHKG